MRSQPPVPPQGLIKEKPAVYPLIPQLVTNHKASRPSRERALLIPGLTMHLYTRCEVITTTIHNICIYIQYIYTFLIVVARCGIGHGSNVFLLVKGVDCFIPFKAFLSFVGWLLQWIGCELCRKVVTICTKCVTH